MKRKKIIFEKPPKHNSAVLFKHSESLSHVKPDEGRRFTIRQFYYKSESIEHNFINLFIGIIQKRGCHKFIMEDMKINSNNAKIHLKMS